MPENKGKGRPSTPTETAFQTQSKAIQHSDYIIPLSASLSLHLNEPATLEAVKRLNWRAPTGCRVTIDVTGVPSPDYELIKWLTHALNKARGSLHIVGTDVDTISRWHDAFMQLGEDERQRHTAAQKVDQRVQQSREELLSWQENQRRRS